MTKKYHNRSDTCLRYCKTTCLSLGFLTLGLAIALPGPTLPTLAHNLEITIEKISFVLPARAVGYLCGSVLSGLILNKLDQHMMLFMSLTLTAVGSFFIPWVNLTVLLAILMSTIGLSMGFLDTGGNVMCLKIWGEESGPYMQLLHFSFAAGATLAPFIAQPFILDLSYNSTFTKQSANSTPSATHLTMATSETHEVSSSVGFRQVSWAFIIASALSMVVSLSFLFLWCSKANELVSHQEDTTKNEGVLFRFKMLVLLFLFFLVYVGMEVAFGLYVFTFSTKSERKYSKDEATAINGLFWGAFALGRFTSIFVSKFLSPVGLLRCDLLGTVTATVMFLCFPLYATSASWMFSLAVFIYGISIASIFPTGITWAEQYITINSRAASALVVGAAVGEMICPLVVGQFIDAQPMSLMYFVAGSSACSVILYVLLQLLASTKGLRIKGLQLASVKNAEDQEDTLFESMELLHESSRNNDDEEQL